MKLAVFLIVVILCVLGLILFFYEIDRAPQMSDDYDDTYENTEEDDGTKKERDESTD